MKRLVLCFDGTWNTPDQRDRGTVPTASNVTKLALAIRLADAWKIPQRAYYHTGLGTGRGLDRILGGAFGYGISRNIQDGYDFLLREFEPGDELFLFGFSRGAYTARSLAGLIRSCGVLLPRHRDKITAAYRLYRRRDKDSKPAAQESVLFRKTYSHQPDVRIRFIGVWDTVGALGIPSQLLLIPARLFRQFHDVNLSSFVDRAYQVLAIDEKRRSFEPTLWEQQPHATGQVIEQVWCAGVHTNVGGGYEDTGLSDLALQWMLERAAASGLAVDPGAIGASFHPDPLGALRDSRRGLYRLVLPYVRPIAAAIRPMPRGSTGPSSGNGQEGGPTFEAVHCSVGTRIRNPRMNYTPDNVLEA